MLLLHGDGDYLAPVEDTRLLAARLREAGARVHVVDIPHAQHGFEMAKCAHEARAIRIIKHFLRSLSTGAGGSKDRREAASAGAD